MTKQPDIDFVVNHIEKALGLLIQQFRGKEKWTDILSALLNESQNLENTFKDLYYNRSINTAVGTQLDGIGQILGLERGGLNDDDYRIALKFQAFLNQSKGEPETLIAALKVFTDSTKVHLYEIFPAEAYGWFDNPTHIIGKLDEKMDSLCAAGVKWGGSIIGNDQPFIFDEGYKIPPDAVTLYGSFAIVDAGNNLITDGTQGQFSIATG